jgi:hypothetical protein
MGNTSSSDRRVSNNSTRVIPDQTSIDSSSLDPRISQWLSGGEQMYTSRSKETQTSPSNNNNSYAIKGNKEVYKSFFHSKLMYRYTLLKNLILRLKPYVAYKKYFFLSLLSPSNIYIQSTPHFPDLIRSHLFLNIPPPFLVLLLAPLK